MKAFECPIHGSEIQVQCFRASDPAQEDRHFEVKLIRQCCGTDLEREGHLRTCHLSSWRTES